MTAASRQGRWVRRGARRLLSNSEAGVILALVVLVGTFAVLEPAFLSPPLAKSILTVVSFLGIIAIGQTILLVCGEFDLSVGSVAGLSAIVAAEAMTQYEVPIVFSLLIGIGVGGALGLINGVVVVRFGIPAFIQTLGMLFVAKGITQVITNGAPVYPLPDSINVFGQANIIAGLGWPVITFVILAALGDTFLRFTAPGRNCYAVGGNIQVAHLVGIRTDRYKTLAFGLTGALSAVGGIFVMANIQSGSTAIGSGWELLVIAGVVVGGVSLWGGVGTVVGAVTGVLLLQVVQSGLVVIGVNPNWQTVAVGFIMVLAVGIDVLRRRIILAESSSGRSGADNEVSHPQTKEVAERLNSAAGEDFVSSPEKQQSD